MRNIIESGFVVNGSVSVEIWEPGLTFVTTGTVVEIGENAILVKLNSPTIVSMSDASVGTYPIVDAVLRMAGQTLAFEVNEESIESLWWSTEANERAAGYVFPHSHGCNASFDAGDFSISVRIVTVAKYPLDMDDDLIQAMRVWFDKRWGSTPGAQPFDEIRMAFEEMLSRRWQEAKNQVVNG
jgi:hypothetical protein